MEMSNINNCLSFPLNLSSAAVRSNHNPKKKRTKFLRLITSGPPKPKTTRRPDPTAPKITRPCTECGKKFWSWKALFGHMRCHPERQWRGINPPPNFRQPPEEDDPIFTEEDQEVAACLLILANQRGLPEYSNSSREVNRGTPEYSTSGTIGEAYVGDGAGPSSFRFECSSCKKVFNSHQALGGHRASHKNVKGCYANTKKDEEEEEEGLCLGTDMSSGHKCSVCSRIFSSGQALGGHKRCHLEKMVSASGLGTRVCGLDLNFPADPIVEEDYDHHHDSSSYSPSFGPLDLRLGL